MTRSSAALVAAGNSIEESVALTAAANTIIQDADSVGNALKTVSMRIRGTSTEELEAAGEETDGLIENTSKLYSKVKALTAVGGKEGISILGDDGKYLSTYQILTKIAERWEEITKVGNDAALLEILAGKTRGSVVAALLQQPEILKNAYKDAANAEGSALKENEAYLDSIQGRIDQFTNAVQTMWSNTLDDELIKSFIDLGTEIIKIVDNVGLLQSALVALGAIKFREEFASLFGANWFANKKTKSQTQSSDPRYENAKKELDEYRKGVQKNNEATEESIELVEKQGKTFGTTFKSIGKQAVNMTGSIATMVAATALFELAMKGFSFLEDVWKESHKGFEELNEEFQQLQSEADSCESDISSLNSELEENQNRIDELLATENLTYVEQEELQKLQEASAELERQIALKETLQTNLQKGTNAAAVEAANAYLGQSFSSEESKEDRVSKSSETGSQIGKVLGNIAGILTAKGLGKAIGGAVGTAFGGPAGTAIGVAIGTAAGSALGSWVGSWTEEKEYDEEQTVSDTITSIKDERQALIKARDDAMEAYANLTTDNPAYEELKQRYQDAESALNTYDENMADSVRQLSEFYNGIDPETASDTQMDVKRQLGDLIDTYNIIMGGSEAVGSAIDRIFGADADEKLKSIRKQMESAAAAGKEINLEDYFGSDVDYAAFKKRLHDLGVYVYQVERRFEKAKVAAEAFNNVSLAEVAKGVKTFSDGVKNLKEAFDETLAEGIVSPDTLISLKETFGVDEYSAEWDAYCNTMMSGIATTNEMTKATERLATAFVKSKMFDSDLSDKSKKSWIAALETLGIKNAEDFVDSQLQDNMLKEIANSASVDTDAVKQKFEAARRNRFNEDSVSEDVKAILRKSWEELTEEEITKLAGEYSITPEISLENAVNTASKYGIAVENKMLEETVDLLNQKIEAQQKYDKTVSDANAAQAAHDTWIQQKEDIEARIEAAEAAEANAQTAIANAQNKINALIAPYNTDDNLNNNINLAEWTRTEDIFGTHLTNKITGAMYNMSLNENKDDPYLKALNQALILTDQLTDKQNEIARAQKNLADARAELAALQDEEPDLVSDEMVADAKQNVDNCLSELNRLYGLDDTTIDMKFDITLGEVGTVFDEYNSKMETLAQIQHEVADGFTISAEKAREFAETYPEILSMATTTADGQIQLNENVVNAMLEGKRAELNAEIDKQIEELKAKIAGVEAEKQLAQEQLDLARNVINGKLQMSADQLVAEISNSNALKAALEAAGLDNASASKLAYAAMSQNAGEYESIVKEVAETNALNFDQSACDTANSLLTNFTNMQGVVTNFMLQCQEAAKAVAGIASGIEAGVEIGVGGAGGEHVVDLSGYKVTAAEFVGTDAEIPVEFKEIDIHQFLGNLQKEIEGYDLTIDSLNGQIELLEAQKNRKWEEFHPDYDEKTGKIKDDSDDGSDDDESALDKIKKKYERQLAMLDAQKQYLENEISRLEAENEPVSKSLYEEQIKIEEKKLKLYEQERAELLAAMNTVPKHSNDWWEMAEAVWQTEHAIQDSTLAIIEMNDAITQLHIDAFDKIDEAHGNKSKFFEDQIAYVEDYIGYLESLGIDVPSAMYDKIIAITEESLAEHQATLADLEKQAAVVEARIREENGGELNEDDEEYIRIQERLRQAESDVLADQTALANAYRDRREGEWEKFDKFIDGINELDSEIDHINGLLDGEKVAEKDGSWTKDGITQLGLHYQAMETNREEAERLAEEIRDLEAARNTMSTSDYGERLKDLTDRHWDAIEAVEDEKDAIVDLNEARIDAIREGVEEEIEAYNELIELKQKELDAERDLHNFRKNIKDQTKDIASLERRIAAMSGSTDAATVAERTRLQAELHEAQEGLNDTYYDHSMDAQSQALSDEQEAFEESKNKYIENLEKTLENAELLIETTMNQVLANADIVFENLNLIADERGIVLSDELISPWESAGRQATAFKEQVATDMDFIINGEGMISAQSDAGKQKLEAMFGAGSTAAIKFTTESKKSVDAIKTKLSTETPTLQKYLRTPWDKGTEVANTFSNTTKNVLSNLVANAKSAAGQIDTYAKGIISDMKAAQDAIDKTGGGSSSSGSGSGGNSSGSGSSGNSGNTGGDNKKETSPTKTVKASLTTNMGGQKITHQAIKTYGGNTGRSKTEAYKFVQNSVKQQAYNRYKTKFDDARLDRYYSQWDDKIKYEYYAKGTTDTKKDQWAIVDEYGPELIMHADPTTGRLQYLTKGSSVIPKGLTEELMKIGEVGLNGLQGSGSVVPGINLMNSYISKPEFNISFEALVRADRVDDQTMPELKKLVRAELDRFTKHLNYNIKR